MSDGPLSPEEVAHRGFPTAFRGFDTGEVRTYLQRVANELRSSTSRERELHRRLADAEYRAANPVIDGDTLTRGLGEEMARILATAQQAASELKARAEENAARILREAHEQAQRIRAQAEAVLADRSEEAEAQAAEIRRAAEVEAAGALERARREAASAMADVEAKSRQLVNEAQAARSRIIADLTRRRRAMMVQVEQLRAGRERLLEAYRMVRRTTDEVADELQRVEAEARQAAAGVGEPAAADAEPAEEIDDVLTAFPERPQETAPGAGGQSHADSGSTRTAAARVPAGPRADTAVTGGAERPAPAPAPAPVAAADAAPRPEEPAVPADEVAPAPAVSEPGAEGERRPASLRLVPRPSGDARAGQLDIVERPAQGEGVRIISTSPVPRPVPSPTTVDPPTEEAPVDEAATVDGEAPAPAVEELFARIRAGRADAVAKAHEILGLPPEDVAAPAVESGRDAAVDVSGVGAVAAPPPSEGEEGLLQRRDRAVEGIERQLARKLKRALQDEQNEVLDRLRSAKGAAEVAAVLTPVDDQAHRYRSAAEELLVAAAAEGAAFVSGGSDARPDTADLADELAASLAEPLRRALERALGGESGGDPAALVERIGAAYRECKAQRIEGLAGDSVTAAFSRGALAAMPPGGSARWVVDDDGRPCPDCDDNALAGPTPSGETFPTGQAHPPAHAGCRCLLAPADVAASANGSG